MALSRTGLYMVLELVQGGELFSVVHTEQMDGVPNGHARFYAACILESLSHLHMRNIAYRYVHQSWSPFGR